MDVGRVGVELKMTSMSTEIASSARSIDKRVSRENETRGSACSKNMMMMMNCLLSLARW